MPREKKDQDTAPQEDFSEETLAPKALPEAPDASQTDQDKIYSSVNAPAPTPDARETDAPSRPSGAKTLWKVLVFLFKLGIFLVVIAVIAAAVYFGWPIVYNQYILPVQNNTAQVAILQTQLQQNQDQISVLQTQLPALETSQAQQNLDLTALAPQMETLAASIETHTRAIAELDSQQNSLQTENQIAKTELEQQTALLKSMELLSRARLFLYQSNFGLAKQDVQTARDLLAKLAASPVASTDKILEEVIQRLDLTISRLPEFPVAASDDLDIAWQILLQGKSMPIPVTPTPVVIEVTAAPALPTPSASETTAPTAAPTATP